MGWRTKVARWLVQKDMTGTELMTALFGVNAQGPRRGSAELLAAYDTMPWLRAVTGRVSWAVSAVPWRLFVAKNKETGKAYRRRDLQRSMDPNYRIEQFKMLSNTDGLKEIENHPMLDFLDRGNPSFSGQVGLQLTQQHLDLVGASMWVLERNGLRLPSVFYPIPITWVTRWPTPELNTYLIASPRGSKEVPCDDVILFRHPMPSDPYSQVSSGIGMTLGDELETDEYAAKHMKAWFKNRALPAAIVSVDNMQKGEGTRFEDHWMKKLSGTSGVNMPLFSNRKMTVDILSQSFQEMQLSQLRKDQRDIIIHVYGAPPEIFGIIENSNRSTIDAADYLFAKHVQVPRLEFLRSIFQMQIAEKYDPRLIIDYVSPIMADREFELKVRSAMPAAWNVDEWRHLGGSAPMENKKEGAMHLAPFNLTAVESMTDLLTPVSETPPPDNEEEDDEPIEEEDDEEEDDEDDTKQVLTTIGEAMERQFADLKQSLHSRPVVKTIVLNRDAKNLISGGTVTEEGVAVGSDPETL